MNLLTALLSSAGVGLHLAAWILAIIRWRTSGMPHESYGLMAAGSLMFSLSAVVSRSVGFAAFQAGLTGIYAWLWWKGRRRGRMKKAAKELGEKSRARVQALVDQLTPSPIPTPGGAS